MSPSVGLCFAERKAAPRHKFRDGPLALLSLGDEAGGRMTEPSPIGIAIVGAGGARVELTGGR